jgi:hypothetical protein
MAIKRGAFSEYLHQRRLVLGKAWKEILSDAYLSRATLHRIRHGDPHHPIAEVDSLRSLAHALGFESWPELVAAYDAGDLRTGAAASLDQRGRSAGANDGNSEDAVLSLSRALNLTPTEVVRRLALGSSAGDDGHRNTDKQADGWPTALRMNELRPTRSVPHFTSGVAASRRVEKLEEQDVESRLPAAVEDTRVFTIPVDGDCQEPVWKDGEIVLFSFDAYDREGIISGKSYYLAFTDGSTTFKRVFVDPDDHETYVLRCWNTVRYPQEKRVHFSEVVRVARALCKQVNPEG